jgi:hypothetical protein
MKIKQSLKAALVLSALLLSRPSFSGPIADTFRDGVFGLAWGATAVDIEAKFPSGKWRDVPGGLRYYTVRDGRAILGIERKRNNDITFGLSSAGRLSSVQIMFPKDGQTYASLITRTKEQFGPTETIQDSANQENKVAPSSVFSSVWPIDEGIDVRLVNFISVVGNVVSLTVTNTNVKPASPSGFE